MMRCVWIAGALALVFGCSKPDQIEPATPAPATLAEPGSTESQELLEAQAKLAQILAEPDPKLRPLRAVIDKWGYQFDTDTTWDDEPISVDWRLSPQPSADDPCLVVITIPEAVTPNNRQGAVMKGWSSLHPQILLGAELAIIELVQKINDDELAEKEHSGWSFRADQTEPRTYSIKFWRTAGA